jgi:hypothetical protein
MRMCVDYRKLDDLTRKDRTPLLRIDELLDSLYVAHYFSTRDLYNGYHQVRVKDRATYVRQDSELITDCSCIAFYPLDSATIQLDSKR